MPIFEEYGAFNYIAFKSVLKNVFPSKVPVHGPREAKKVFENT